MAYQKSDRLDVYKSITDQIIAAIEAGTGKVQMPWHRSGLASALPVNISSHKPYQGINILSL